MSDSIFICTLEGISDPGSRAFDVQINGEQLSGFIVLKDSQVFAYRNSCPHTGSPLDWVEHQFLDMDQQFIQCAVHDARFDVASGLCIAGPCSGDSLLKLEVIQKDLAVYVSAGSAGIIKP